MKLARMATMSSKFWDAVGICILLINLNSSFIVLAQTTSTGWVQPVNLSHSGGTTDPMLVVDSKGVVNVIWEDIFSGYKYVSGDGKTWSTPATVTFPFDHPAKQPILIADSNARVFAFWVDGHNNFLYSSVQSSSLSNRGSWTDPVTIARNTVGFFVRLDGKGAYHLLYVIGLDSADMPSGIYYQQIQVAGSLSKPTIIDQSPYYRRLSADGVLLQGGEAANLIQVGTAVEAVSSDTQTAIFVAWTNPTLKRTYLRESQDEGATWGKPIEVAGPENGSSASPPQNVYLRANQNQVILMWQEGQSNSCENYYQASSNAGATWDTPATFLPQMTSCSNDLYWVTVDPTVYLLTSLDRSTYVTAWNGSGWSDASLITDITNFSNPDMNSSVDLQKRKFARANQTLYVVGSDQGEGGDVWISSADIGLLSPTSPGKRAWTRPAVVAGMDLTFETPVLLADSRSHLHAFWSQADERNPQGAPVAIYHASWEQGAQASSSVALQSPGGKANQESLAVDAKGNFLAVWSGGQSGEIYFSSAPQDQADTQSDWYQPVELPSPRSAGAYPVIFSDSDGTIWVAYAIPINENRGVYLTKSQDKGKSWTDVVQIFDAIKNNCEMIDQLNLGETEPGTFHLSWRCSTLPGGLGPLSIGYSNSTDGGKTWKPAVTLVERPVQYSKIACTGGATIHLLWEETSNGQTGLWEMVSSDDGGSWGNPVNIAASNPGWDPVTAVVDPTGQVYLVQIRDINRNYSVMYWKWDGNSWFMGENSSLEGSGISQIETISAAIVPDGHLAVILSGENELNETAGENGLFYLSLPIEIPARNPSPTITRKPTVMVVASTPSPTAILTPTEQPTLNAALANLNPGNGGSSSNQLVMVIGIAAGISIIVIVVAVIYDRRYRQRE